MITCLYLDTSALVKAYLSDELGAPATMSARESAAVSATTLVSRAETEAALAKGARTGALSLDEAELFRKAFAQDWEDLIRIPVTEDMVARAGDLAFQHGLRGYDAVQLASALAWAEALEEPVTFATFDVQLWRAAAEHDALSRFPDDLPALLQKT